MPRTSKRGAGGGEAGSKIPLDREPRATRPCPSASRGGTRRGPGPVRTASGRAWEHRQRKGGAAAEDHSSRGNCGSSTHEARNQAAAYEGYKEGGAEREVPSRRKCGTGISASASVYGTEGRASSGTPNGVSSWTPSKASSGASSGASKSPPKADPPCEAQADPEACHSFPIRAF